MKPRWERIAFVAATTFAALSGLASLATGADDSPEVIQPQGSRVRPVALTTPHPTAVLHPRASTIPQPLPPTASTEPTAATIAGPQQTATTVATSPRADEQPPPAAPTSTPEMAIKDPTADPGAVEPTAPVEPPTPTADAVEAATCHPAYVECLAVVDDLDCADVAGPINVREVGNDPYRLDADFDGVGCER